MMESYKFHYLRNFHHFHLMSTPHMILVLCLKVCKTRYSLFEYRKTANYNTYSKVESKIKLNMTNFIKVL